MHTSVQNRAGAGPFQLGEEFEVSAFREALDRAGYNAARIKMLKRDLKSNDGVDLALLDRRTLAKSDPLHTCARLFFLGREVSAAALREAMEPLSLEAMLNVGLVRRDRDSFRAVVRIERHHELIVCSDFVSHAPETPLATDHVLGVGPGAISLAALTPQSSVDSVLDLGTGGGIQALLAAPHAERVVGTDICPRALNFAAMNARLNEFENLELRAGSFFEPVAGERFERIVANPPFVISPASRFIYRDGGWGGDAVSEHCARTAAAHLEEGGYAVMLLNWHHASADDWAERPKSWTDGNGCDIRWMRFNDEDPLSYAAGWLRQEGKRDTESAARVLEEWVQYYENAGITQIASGAVVMRKRSGRRNWLRCDDIPLDISMTACGDQIERIFDGEDLLFELTDERELLDRRLQLHSGHRLEQRLAVRNGGWAVESNMLHLTNGMDFCGQIDVHAMQLLAALDGSRTVREAAVPIAEALERSVDDLVPICLEMTKRMLRIGLLVRI